MDKIQLNAYAKINLGLDVVRRLENGYHEVKMIMQTISLHDTILLEKTDSAGIVVNTNKKELPGDENNLVYRVASMLMDEFGTGGGVRIYLEKNIPIAAGLAGGSADAAAVFRGMNRLFGLGLGDDDLRSRGVKLGADIPYCITGGTCLSEGIGEKLSELPAMPDCFVLVAKPPVGVSTKWVYENLHADRLTFHPNIDGVRAAIVEGNLKKLCDNLNNVLETVTVTKYPVITEIKNIMQESGALAALMSGSGPSVFGIFEAREEVRSAADKIKELKLSGEVFEAVPVAGTDESVF